MDAISLGNSAGWIRGLWRRCVAPRTNKLQLVDSLGLGERRSVSVLCLEGRRFLIGSTPQSVTLLAELQPDPASASGTMATGPALTNQDLPETDLPGVGRPGVNRRELSSITTPGDAA